MNEKNLAYLNDQIKFTGFGENLSEQLLEKVEQQLDTFTLQHQTKYGQNSMNVELYFSKSLTHDMYFFNAYVVNLKSAAGEMIQTFYINKGNNITLKEAYNLMSGRSVHKNFQNRDGENYSCWVQLDPFSTTPNGNYKLVYYHQNYGYDLEVTIAKYPIMELELDEFKESIIASLKKGNLQMVTFEIEGKDEIRFIEANPKFKSITIYDESMQKQFWQKEISPIKQVAEETTASKEKTQTTRQIKEEQEVMSKKSKIQPPREKIQETPEKSSSQRKKRPRTIKKI